MSTFADLLNVETKKPSTRIGMFCLTCKLFREDKALAKEIRDQIAQRGLHGRVGRPSANSKRVRVKQIADYVKLKHPTTDISYDSIVVHFRHKHEENAQ